nr:uncharacterized protein LOC109188287 [Ipomoea batatas]
MAVAMEGFAIREYVSRMRSVDVVKCWPLDEETREEDMRARLPPIAVKKFRWWFDELKSVRSGSGNEHSKLVEEVEEDIDVEIEEARAGKGKAKAPKKRSIVEIFAVAPQVERVESDDYMDESNSDDDDSVQQIDEVSNLKLAVLRESLLNSKSKVNSGKTKTKKKKKVTLMKLNMGKNMIINKGKKETAKKKKKVNNCVDLLIGVKEKLKKHGEQPPPNPFPRSRSSMPKELQKDISEDIPTHKKKPRMKRPPAQKQTKTMTTSKLTADHPKAMIPVRGILKNNTKLSPEESPPNYFMRNPNQANFSGNAHANKHVTFSGKDDTGSMRKNSAPIRCSDFHNFFNLNAEVASPSIKVPFTERVKALSVMEVGGVNGMAPNDAGNEITVPPVEKKQLSVMSDVAGTSSFQGCKTYSKNCSFDRCVVVGQDAESSDSLHSFERQPNDPFYTCNPGFLSMSQEAYRNRKNNQAIPQLTNSSSATKRLIGHLMDPVPRITAVCSMDCVQAFHRPSSYLTSFNENLSRMPMGLSHTTNENFSGHAMHYLPFPPSPSQELMHTICSTPDWKQRVTVCGDKNTCEEYVRLPLNSHGELIKSSGNGSSVRSSTSLAVKNTDLRSWNERISQKRDQLNYANVKDSMKSSPNCPLPSRLGIYEYQDAGRASINLGHLKENNLMISLESDKDAFDLTMKKDNHLLKQFESAKIQQHGNSNYFPQHVTQSTMRLMGKEFKVDRRDLQGLEDAKFWTDKQIIAEHFPANGGALDNSNIKSHNQGEFDVHAVLGKLKGPASCSLEVVNQVVPEHRVHLAHFNHQIDVMHQSRLCSLRQSYYPEWCTSDPSSASSAAYNRQFVFKEPFIYGHESSRVSSQIPVIRFNNCNSSQILTPISAGPENTEKLSHATKSAFNFPFLHPDCRGHPKPAGSESYSNCMVPRLPDAPKRGVLLGFHQLYNNSDGSSLPSSMLRTTCQTESSVYLAREDFSSINSSFHPTQLNALSTTALAKCSQNQIQLGLTLNAATKNKHGHKIKFKEMIKSRISYTSLGLGRKRKKRSAAASDDSVIPKKIPNLGSQRDCSSTVTAHDNFEGGLPDSMQALELESASEKVNNVEWEKRESLKDTTDSHGLMSSKVDSAMRSGPIKLTPGTKHILKPSQNLDQPNCKPSISTLSFADTASAKRSSEPEKPIRIYEF